MKGFDMATSEMGLDVPSDANREEALEKARAVLQKLPAADKVDLFDLILDLPDTLSSGDQDRIAATFTAMAEIIGVKHESKTEVVAPPDTASGEAAPAVYRSWKEWIAKRVSTLRTERGWTQKDLADRAGLPQSHISRIECERLSPSRKTVEKLAVAFGIEVGELDPCEG